jgi:hypothetical protein
MLDKLNLGNQEAFELPKLIIDEIELEPIQIVPESKETTSDSQDLNSMDIPDYSDEIIYKHNSK